ncbi:MAG: DUF2760 domain-containing protein [Parachlamydiaceae bacterium]|nr:DUF2760 domain-containing protein [Parachlamydiaceae bacterium]
MGLMLAFKAFFRALKEPEKTQLFLDEMPSQVAGAVSVADHSHLRLLALLQQSGRMIDFFKEDISTFSDAQVGAAVRKIHHDCSQSLEELVTIRPVMDENEGATIMVPAGYDPTEIKIVGQVRGDLSLSGVIRHRGWKAHKRSLPKKVGEQSSDIICPAEVEVR